jgi:hypothetical protein
MVIPKVRQMLTVVFSTDRPILAAQIDTSDVVIFEFINQVFMARQVNFWFPYSIFVQISQV